MPAIRKVKKADILDVCIKIIESEGMESINARRVAKELKSSTQPIYYVYSNIDAMKNDTLQEIARIFYEEIYEKNNEQFIYKDIGRNYIKFAKNRPTLFNLLFDSEINNIVSSFMNLTGPADRIRETIIQQTGLSEDKAVEFHKRMWLYANGIANLSANKICKFSDNDIETLLGNQYISQILLEIQNGNINKKDVAYIIKN